ncbi:hypothetical protein KDH_11900 [Dictyobacter sp. S3.2.2.5]|uniref:TerB N-terminal domain-containing protein n=1 Tax=Dictyobacter halimunensis TaxID=3026934 RepID=A0ABQ6FJF2_9CHLR|nr:hypothetical protein KDH_11900 [Dictyobacter sp. S3.2.2.5]
MHQESEQLQERLTVENEEERRSFSFIIRQEAHSSKGSRDVSNTEAKQIPDKVKLQEEKTSRLDAEQSQEKEPALSTANTEALSFWEQARQWKDRAHEPVSIEKFKHYHSDYTLMDTRQLAWYFYWRNEIRSGLYPETDVGYILIHTYEALECIGFTNPTQACERLIALWKNYRDSFPLLDQYLVPWIADFCAVHNLSLTPMQWYAQVLTVPDCDTDAQLIAEAWLRQGADWAQIPATVLYKLVGFNTQTKFYQKMRQKNALDEGYRLAVAAVDEHLSSKFDRPALITRYGKGTSFAVVRKPFNGVLMEHTYAHVVIAEVNAAFGNAELRYALLGILKYADHIQRKMHQKTVQPFVPTIDLSWQEVIESILVNRSPIQNSASLSANHLADEADQETISKLREQDEKLGGKEQYQKTLRPIPVSAISVGIIGQFDSQLSKNARKEDTHLNKTAQRKPITTNVVPSPTGSELQSVHISAIEQRVAVLKQYWYHFDEIHARQAEGMTPLHWGPITDPLSIGFEHRCQFYKPDPYPLYQRHLPANLLSEVEQLWGTTMLPRWPESIVSEPFPHEILTKAFGVALSFWHSCALNAWFFCEGSLYLDDLSGLEDFYRKEIQILKDMGMPINEHLFKDLGTASVKLDRVYSTGDDARRGGFEGIRNIISYYRRLWAEAYLDRYIHERWEAEIRKVKISYRFSVDNRGGAPPTAKQFAKDAKNATNYWFGGDVRKLYEAIREQSPLQPQRVAIMPFDRLAFALAVFNTLKEDAVKPQPALRDPYTVERRYYQLNQLAEFSFWYVQLEEALGYTPKLGDFGMSKFAKCSEVLDKNVYKAWTTFSSTIEAVKREFPTPGEKQESEEITFTTVGSALVKVEKSAELMVENEKPTRTSWGQPARPLDTEAISKLRAESDQLQVRLTIDVEEEVQVEQSPQFTPTAEVELITSVINTIADSDLEVDEDWKGIVQHWQPEHWEIIILLYQEQYAQLITVERKVRRPVSRLIDEINLPVDEQLGDLLVDPDTRLIPQHLHETVSILVNWYLSSKSR